MTVTVKLLRSETPGRVPTTAELDFGMLFINVADGKVYIKRKVGEVESIHEVGDGVTQIVDKLIVANITASSVSVNPNLAAVYRIDATVQDSSTLNFAAGPAGISSEVTLFIKGQPSLTFNGVSLTDRMVNADKVDGGSGALGTNFSVYRFIWTGYEWVAYKDVSF